MTVKLKKLAKTLGKNGSLQKDLIAAGYSSTTAREQQSVTHTKGFKQLLESYLPVTDSFKVTKDAHKAIKQDNLGNAVPDHQIRLKAAEQVYKLHGVISNEPGSNNTTTINILNYGEGDGIEGEIISATKTE